MDNDEKKNEEVQMTIEDFLNEDIKQKLFAAAALAAA